MRLTFRSSSQELAIRKLRISVVSTKRRGVALSVGGHGVPQPKENQCVPAKILLGTLAAAAVAAPLALAASPANAATALTNASFEDATVDLHRWLLRQVNAGHQTLTGWTAGGAGVDIVDARPSGSRRRVAQHRPERLQRRRLHQPDRHRHPGRRTTCLRHVRRRGRDAPARRCSRSPDSTTTRSTRTRPRTDVPFAATGHVTTLTTRTTRRPAPIADRIRAAAGPVIDDVAVTAAPNVVKTKVWNDLDRWSRDLGSRPTRVAPHQR